MNGVHARRWLLQPGDRLNNTYAISRPLAHGGMGEVYVGHSLALGEDVVAIKVILPENARDENFQKLFGREARALLRVRHPAIVGYRSFSHDPVLDLHYIVTDYVEGENLGARLARGPIDRADVRRLARGLVAGLAAVHETDIIHRDLAPDNIILEGGQIARPKIIDFGVVKDTSGGLTTIVGDNVVGKLNFMAPEQLGKPRYDIGPWTDAYSLGLVLVAALRGKPVDMGGSFADAIDKRQAPLDLSDLAPSERAFLEPMLRPHPADRCRSMAEVLALLDAPVGEATVFANPVPPAPAPTVPPPAPPSAPPAGHTRRRVDEEPAAGGAKWVVGAGLAVVVAAVGLALGEATGLTNLAGGAPAAPLEPLGETAAPPEGDRVALADPEPTTRPTATPTASPSPSPSATPTPTPTPTLAPPRPTPTARPTAIAVLNPDDRGAQARPCNPGPYIVFFEWDRSSITAEAAQILDLAAGQFAKCGASARVYIAGHTDREKSSTYNVGLSERMVASVRSYLQGRGISAGRISTQAFGESRPRVPTADGVREAQNRRVEITFGP